MLQVQDSPLHDPNRPYEGDEKVPVQFYMGVILDDPKTEQEGRPIFMDVECIKIFNSKDNIIDRPVRDTDKQRWPRQYAAWKNSGENEPGGAGMKLELWPQVTRAQAEEFKFFKVYTVEQLAELPDVTGQKIMGFQGLKIKAQAYLAAAKQDAPLVKMQEELRSRDLQIANLQDQIDKLGKKLAEKK